MQATTAFFHTRRFLLRWLGRLGGALTGLLVSRVVRIRAAEDRRQFTVHASRYRFEPSGIAVDEGDLVKIEFDATDIPHSFTLDAYRIVKRAKPGAPVSFEFLADQPGTFPFYCNLAIDQGCRAMRGELVVRRR